MNMQLISSYHPPCLTCDTCKRSLSGVEFFKGKSGDLICNDCYMITAPKCIKCSQTFGPGESYKTVAEQFYHGKCFVCSGPCKKPIDAEFYDFENSKYVCTDCYDKFGSDAVKN